MKTQIRTSVFETNSSSTHSICIAKDIKLNLPKSLHFSFREFGWEYNTLYSTEEKASYLYTGLIANNREEDFYIIVEILKANNIKVTYDSLNNDHGYIDHSDMLKEFFDDILNNNEKLLNYLFSDLSFIITGNDNSDTDVNINVSYPHEEYYKGN